MRELSSRKLYHIGFRGQISKSTLADAVEKIDYHIYQDFAYHLIFIARRLYQNEKLAKDLDYSLYAFDSTTIDLCLSLFPWAHFRKNKAAIKMHTLLDLRGSIPTFISLTTGKVHDVNVLDTHPGACSHYQGFLLSHLIFSLLIGMLDLYP